MDEFEPSPQAVARHRAQLRDAIDGLNGVPLEQVTPRPPKRGRRLVAAAAAIAVLGGAAVIARGAARTDEPEVAATLDDGGDRDAPEPVDPASGQAVALPPACGSELPFALPVPDGYAGPVTGAGEDGQLVQRWTGATGTIEARWPAGEENPFGFVGDDRGFEPTPEGDGGVSSWATESWAMEPQTTADGRTTTRFGIQTGGLGDGVCQTVEFTVVDQDDATARVTASHIHQRLLERGGPLAGPVLPLVADSTTADAPPPVVPCQAPDGVPHSDYQGGAVTDVGTYATPAEALQAFVDTKTVTDVDTFGVEVTYTTITDAGYSEIQLPNGTIAYAVSANGDPNINVVVHTVPNEGGWTVNRWDASGC